MVILLCSTRISSTARGAGWIADTILSLRELVTYGDIQEVVTKLEITTYIPIIGHGSLVSPAAAELELTAYAVEVDTTKELAIDSWSSGVSAYHVSAQSGRSNRCNTCYSKPCPALLCT